jgi:hypothetical protein
LPNGFGALPESVNERLTLFDQRVSHVADGLGGPRGKGLDLGHDLQILLLIAWYMASQCARAFSGSAANASIPAVIFCIGVREGRFDLVPVGRQRCDSSPNFSMILVP